MPLTCSCEFDNSPDWYWEGPTDYQAFDGNRRKRCSSCKRLIELGACCTEFARTREARTEVEISIFGEGDPEAIALPSYYLCEECSDLWFSLDELGFKCVSPDEPLRELVREYAAYYSRG